MIDSAKTALLVRLNQKVNSQRRVLKKQVRPAVPMAAVFAGLVCTALQVDVLQLARKQN